MSQAKVDKHKAEKKNRAKTIKRKKIKKVAGTLIGAALVGVLLGFPLGKHLYNINYEKRMENATVSSNLYSYWFEQHWAENYDNLYPDASDIIDTSSLSDEELANLEQAIQEATATNTDATSSDADE